jgi:hypothetical protein
LPEQLAFEHGKMINDYLKIKSRKATS